MPQALPAAKPGNAGGSPIGTASRGSCHELMQNAQAGHPQDAESMSVMSNGEGQPALDVPALNLALPEEHHALQHQQQRQQRSDSSTLSANIISRNAASDDDCGVRATLTATKSDLLDDAAVVEHSYNHGQGTRSVLCLCYLRELHIS